jgi:sialidase-1
MVVSANGATVTEDVAASSVSTEKERIALTDAVRQRCLDVLRDGMKSEEFWPAMHAAEALTLAGRRDEVRAALGPKLATETDGQRRCGLAREIARAGDVGKAQILLDLLEDDEPYAHVHAAESLYKIGRVGDGEMLRKRFQESDNKVLKVMAAAALGRCGSPAAMKYLRDTLADEDITASRLSAWVLARIGDKTDIAAIRASKARAKEPLEISFFEYALANLGDAEGQRALVRNLSSDEAAIRTYACVFAGEARMLHTKDRLIELLDDAEIDVRIRAAQSLLVLAGSSYR